MTKKSFMRGAVILGVAGLIIKVLGAFFRIPLANIIGSEGMGYYQTAYPVYVLFLTVSTAGIPTAIAKLVSEKTAEGDHAEAYRIFKLSFGLLLGIGVASAAILYFGADSIVGTITADQTGAVYAMKAIAPALLFVPMMASFRGYFQGRQDMSPTAASQVIEQTFRVICGLGLAVFLVSYGLPQAAAGASFGATAGSIGGLIGIMIIFLRRKKYINNDIAKSISSNRERAGAIIGKIVIIAIPITIGAAIMPIMNSIDLAIVMRRLQDTGYTYEEANSLYGQLTGLAAPLINFPQVLTQSLAMSLVPAIAAARRTGDVDFLRYNVQLGLRSAMIIGLPCAVGLMALSEPIMFLLYPLQKASAIGAAPCLFILAAGVVFLSSVQTLTGVLQGVGKQTIPVRNLFIGAIAKVIITYTLTSIPSLNVKGAALGTVCAYLIASVLNLYAVQKYTGTVFDFKLILGKPLISAIGMGIVVQLVFRLLYSVLGNGLSTIIAVTCGVFTYTVLMFLVKGITSDEIKMMPMGAKIISRLNKITGGRIK